MRALEPEVFDAVWTAIEPFIPLAPKTHPLGCRRPRVTDRLCFRGILIRLVTGCSWVIVEALLDHRVSDTTLRSCRVCLPSTTGSSLEPSRWLPEPRTHGDLDVHVINRPGVAEP